VEVLNRYEKRFGPSEDVSMEKVRLFVKQKEIGKAAGELNALIKRSPGVNEYRGMLAELYLENGQEGKGLKLLKRLLKRDPSDGFLQFYLADFYAEKKRDTVQANVYLRDALLNDRTENAFKVQYLLKMLVEAEKEGRPLGGIYQRVLLLLERYPEDVSVRMLYSDFLKREGRFEECREELEFVVGKDPQNFLVWEELLLLYNHLNDTMAMAAKGKECIVFFPDEPLPYAMVGLPLLIRRDFTGAISYFRKGVELSAEDTPVKGQLCAYLGDAYYGLDSLEMAFGMFDEALRINPDDVSVLNNYSYYLTLLGQRLDEAERMSAKTLEAEPNNPTFLDTYAWVLFKREDYALARFYMRSAMEKDKDPSEVLYDHYGDILFMNGEVEEAKNMWRKALELNAANDKLRYKIEHGLEGKD
jgi:tetratricopeptide (TPR) repeat protein